MSHRIRQLEDSVGTRLFLRLHRNVVLTPAGSAFLDTVREVLDKLQAASAGIATNRRPVLRVSPAPAIASNWLALHIADFLAKHPEVELEIQSSRQIFDLRASEVDIGIRYGTGAWPGCHAAPLFTEELSPVCSPAYLERSKRLREPKDLRSATLLRTPFMPWKPWFRAASLDWDEPESGPLFKEVLLLQEACANGLGVALAGSILGAPALRSGRLVRLFPLTVASEHAYWAVCLKEKLERPEVASFMDWITALARKTTSNTGARKPTTASV